VNLAVKDLDKSKAFFTALGFSFDPRFTNDQAASLIIAENNIYAMLMTEDFFRTFTPKTLVDARTSTEVLLCLSCESQEETDALVARAVAAGGTVPHPPEDHGFMYSYGFEDLDGHNWGLAYMRSMPA